MIGWYVFGGPNTSNPQVFGSPTGDVNISALSHKRKKRCTLRIMGSENWWFGVWRSQKPPLRKIHRSQPLKFAGLPVICRADFLCFEGKKFTMSGRASASGSSWDVLLLPGGLEQKYWVDGMAWGFKGSLNGKPIPRMRSCVLNIYLQNLCHIFHIHSAHTGYNYNNYSIQLRILVLLV